MEGFCPRFVPGGVIIYLGDAGKKFKIRETAYFERLGIILDEHGKMPDVVVHLEEKNWLVLIEAVTSHGRSTSSGTMNSTDCSKAKLLWCLLRHFQHVKS